MTIRLEDQIGDIVAQNYRTASIFKAKGIDFCCRGHRSLRDVINEKGLVAEDMLKELASTEVLPGSTPPDYAKWRLEYLIDHIISQHHAYIRRQVPVIKAYLDKVFNAHGQTEPSLVKSGRCLQKMPGISFSILSQKKRWYFP